ncbi:MAG TPA: response regulator [Candidatus Nanopelagicales bacterium]
MTTDPLDVVQTMLVVDDEPAICELIAAVADGAGFRTQTASDCRDIDRLVGGGQDITVLDLDLGPRDGDVLRLLAVRAPGSRIVLVSGASAEVVSDAHRRAASYGLRVVGSLRKPFDLSAFRVVLSRCRNTVSA